MRYLLVDPVDAEDSARMPVKFKNTLPRFVRIFKEAHFVFLFCFLFARACLCA